MVVRSTPIDLDLLAKHRGKEFQVRLKAIKDGAGLVKSPQPLEVGGRLILHVPNSRTKRAAVQLFASVVRHYEKQRAFALRWDKLVSPSGTVALKDFLQSTLGVEVSPGTAMAEASAEGEMVYYEFASEELHLPNQGAVAGRADPAVVAPPSGSVADFGTSPLALEGNANRTTRPVAGGGGNGDASPAGSSIEAQAAAAAQEADANSKPFYKEDEEVVELFGMKVSKDNWDRLENLEYTGSHPADASPTRQAPRPKNQDQARRPGPPSSRSFQTADDGDEEDNKVSRFFRKIANKLADKD
jgi:hypothetical protein